MRVTFLGTSAGESYPGLFCECENCSYAREKGGRNLRANTSTLLDGDTMLDVNEPGLQTAARLSLSLAKAKKLFLTHPHEDHLSPYALLWRAATPGATELDADARRNVVSPRFTPLPMMDLYASARTLKTLAEKTPDLLARPEMYAISIHEIREGVREQSGDLWFTPVRARHGEPGFAHSYVFERGGKTLLYALDTGGYDPDMLEILRAHRYDCVVTEGTFGLGALSESHMNLEKNRAFLRWLDENGLWAGERRFVLTHLCPHWTPPYDVYAPMLAPEGITVAYDGMQIEF